MGTSGNLQICNLSVTYWAKNKHVSRTIQVNGSVYWGEIFSFHSLVMKFKWNLNDEGSEYQCLSICVKQCLTDSNLSQFILNTVH